MEERGRRGTMSMRDAGAGERGGVGSALSIVILPAYSHKEWFSKSCKKSSIPALYCISRLAEGA